MREIADRRVVALLHDKHPKKVRAATTIAIVLRRGKRIAYGFNRVKFGETTWHAEEVALKKAGRRALGASMYVIRIRKDGSYGMAMPCPKCQKLLEHMGIAKVKWSDDSWNECSPVEELAYPARL